jgi:hypothetical protein
VKAFGGSNIPPHREKVCDFEEKRSEGTLEFEIE